MATPDGRPRRSDELDPVRRSPELQKYEGKWVATRHGAVVQSADSAAELVRKVRSMGAEGEDLVAEYVAPPSSSWMVGVG